MNTYLKTMFLGLTVGVALVFSASTAIGSGIPVDPSDYTGSRNTPSGGGLSKKNLNNIRISWEITGTGPYHYTYKISNKKGEPHANGVFKQVFFEVSKPLDRNQIRNADPNINQGPADFHIDTGIPNLQTFDIYGIKYAINQASITFDFDTSRAPMWGDFVALGINEGTNERFAVWNNNFGTDPNSGTDSFVGWIPVPNTREVPVPEPTTMLVMGSSLAAAALAKRRKKKMIG